MDKEVKYICVPDTSESLLRENTLEENFNELFSRCAIFSSNELESKVGYKPLELSLVVRSTYTNLATYNGYDRTVKVVHEDGFNVMDCILTACSKMLMDGSFSDSQFDHSLLGGVVAHSHPVLKQYKKAERIGDSLIPPILYIQLVIMDEAVDFYNQSSKVGLGMVPIQSLKDDYTKEGAFDLIGEVLDTLDIIGGDTDV